MRSPNVRNVTKQIPASLGPRGPGENRMGVGDSASMPAKVIASLRFTAASAPNSPRRCTRL